MIDAELVGFRKISILANKLFFSARYAKAPSLNVIIMINVVFQGKREIYGTHRRLFQDIKLSYAIPYHIALH